VLDSINRLNSTTFLCLSQARTWISNVICCCSPFFAFSELRWEVIVCFVNIGGIVDYHYLYSLFKTFIYQMKSWGQNLSISRVLCYN
jgi:hypothetical protein